MRRRHRVLDLLAVVAALLFVACSGTEDGSGGPGGSGGNQPVGGSGGSGGAGGSGGGTGGTGGVGGTGGTTTVACETDYCQSGVAPEGWACACSLLCDPSPGATPAIRCIADTDANTGRCDCYLGGAIESTFEIPFQSSAPDCTAFADRCF